MRSEETILMGCVGWRKEEWEQKWIGVSVMEVGKRKNGMRMDGNEWIEIIDANENENQG